MDYHDIKGFFNERTYCLLYSYFKYTSGKNGKCESRTFWDLNGQHMTTVQTNWAGNITFIVCACRVVCVR